MFTGFSKEFPGILLGFFPGYIPGFAGIYKFLLDGTNIAHTFRLFDKRKHPPTWPQFKKAALRFCGVVIPTCRPTIIFIIAVIFAGQVPFSVLDWWQIKGHFCRLAALGQLLGTQTKCEDILLLGQRKRTKCAAQSVKLLTIIEKQ